MAGDTIGHYRILELLGEGGMGEVYRAEDTSLDREVALKFLPEKFARDASRLARFEREAKLLASMNHPHIAQIHGLEEEEGQPFLVLELVEGPTLSARIARGPIPLEEALPIALQIAQALESAHEKGIIHRDLKPSNVKFTLEREVKVLDFGLAKALGPETEPGDQTQSRTLTAQMTGAGAVLGTAAYMSPEQARGQHVDRRADIWAFGVVLWEMVTGKWLFDGEIVSDMLTGALRAEANRNELLSEAPPSLRRLLWRCLQKDRSERLHDISDARLEIQEALAELEGGRGEEAELPEPSLWKKAVAAWPVLLAAFGLGAMLAGSVSWHLLKPQRAARTPPIRLSVTLPSGVTLRAGGNPVLAISPDGRSLVFGAEKNDTWRLFKRSLFQVDATEIPGTDDGYHPFFSPDGQWVGFFAGNQLKKVPLAGGPPQDLVETDESIGATWGPDGDIIFNVFSRGLFRVSARGGEDELLTAPDFEGGEWDMAWPEFLPDGKAVLYTSWRGLTGQTAQIGVLELATGDKKILIDRGSYARYLPTGHLIFGRGGSILVVPFDAASRKVTGPPVPLPERIFYEHEWGTPHLSISDTGILAFVPGTGAPRYRLVSVDLQGNETPLFDKLRGFMYPRFSPDGGRLAVTISEPEGSHIWVLDLSRGALTKLTSEGTNAFPVWTPDGERVAYYSEREDTPGIYQWRADGSGQAEPLVVSDTSAPLVPVSWTPDGKSLAYLRPWDARIPNLATGGVWLATPDGSRDPQLILERSDQFGPVTSPDGQWLAYVSNEYEIFVQPVRTAGERHQISIDGGLKPMWSPDGRWIYYRLGERIMAVSVDAATQFRADPPQALFEGQYQVGAYTHPNFHVAPDGKSFVMIKPDEDWGRASEIAIVLNWSEQLRRLAPAI